MSRGKSTKKGKRNPSEYYHKVNKTSIAQNDLTDTKQTSIEQLCTVNIENKKEGGICPELKNKENRSHRNKYAHYH